MLNPFDLIPLATQIDITIERYINYNSEWECIRHIESRSQLKALITELQGLHDEWENEIQNSPLPKNWIKEVIENQFTDQVIDHEKAIVTKYEEPKTKNG